MAKPALCILFFHFVLYCGCGICDKLKFYVESAVFETDSGKIVFTFFEDEAPEHVRNFKKLVENGHYDGKAFHRVIPDFVIQAGRDSSSEYSSIDPEINKIHFRGALAAARMDEYINPALRSDSHEFYICLKPLPNLDGKYTVFGRTASGFETVNKIASSPTDGNNKPLKDITIRKAYIDTYFDREKYTYYTNKSEREYNERD